MVKPPVKPLQNNTLLWHRTPFQCISFSMVPELVADVRNGQRTPALVS